ncbi:MAG: site-2 protease family protein [Dehalococcoidia bacterium]|nr:site-2 protease family protein [Dehalococcoidia bacterium]
MLFFNLDLLLKDPWGFLVLMGTTSLALVIAITVHEFSHALVAEGQGDHTAKAMGRLSLNPLAHLDPMGTILLFIVGFGWGKPVPVNPHNLRGGFKLGMAAVALAGPLSNVLTAALLALPIRLGLLVWHSPMRYSGFAQMDPMWILSDVVGIVIMYNLLLAAFNLLPIAPLDGFKVALGLLPRGIDVPFSRLEQYGPGILMAIIGLGYFTELDILWGVIGPVIKVMAYVTIGRPL